MKWNQLTKLSIFKKCEFKTATKIHDASVKEVKKVNKMMEFKLDESKKVHFNKKKNKYIIPCISENGQKLNIEMTEEDKDLFVQTMKLVLTDDCNGVTH